MCVYTYVCVCVHICVCVSTRVYKYIKIERLRHNFVIFTNMRSRYFFLLLFLNEYICMCMRAEE